METNNTYPVYQRLDLKSLPEETSAFYLHMVSNGIGQKINVPVVVAKGGEPGPVVGITAAMHGNELNGLKIIQKLFGQLARMDIKGTIVGVPVVNVPAILNHERLFNDNEDLNRVMPGREDGNMSDVYAFRIMDRIVKEFDYLLDLHTASFGRINSYYIRADLSQDIPRKLAQLQNADIILNNEGADGTLRSAASEIGIPAITLEVGDPNRFQKGMIRSGLEGIYNVLSHLGMIDDEITEPDEPAEVCKRSYWIYADRGGILEVTPDITDVLKKGELIARIRDVFGHVIKEYFAPEDGIVIGKSTHPIGQTGSRILHLGIVL